MNNQCRLVNAVNACPDWSGSKDVDRFQAVRIPIYRNWHCQGAKHSVRQLADEIGSDNVNPDFKYKISPLPTGRGDILLTQQRTVLEEKERFFFTRQAVWRRLTDRNLKERELLDFF